MPDPYYSDYGVTVYADDCFDPRFEPPRGVLTELPDASVDSVVTDPPYELAFMGRQWDASGIAFNPELWRECLRVLKPGGHLLAFGGSRTWHRLVCAVEDAGFEVRDSIAWLYASGFPKSLDVSKAIDKAAGAEREVVGERRRPDGSTRVAARGGAVGISLMGSADGALNTNGAMALETTPATAAAREWQGWGTALKPAFEPIVVARKPLAGTVAENVQEYGVGALNIDGCRIATDDDMRRTRNTALGVMNDDGWQPKHQESDGHAAGRWPSNVVITHAATPDGVDLCVDGCVSGCPVRDLDEQSGIREGGHYPTCGSGMGYHGGSGYAGDNFRDTPGGASRFFPVFRFEAKAPASERPRVDGVAHPTVKPLALMRWLVRLVTPPGGLVLDPFGGSGTTGQACRAEGFDCVLIERDETYLPLIRSRLDGDGGPDLFGGVA